MQDPQAVIVMPWPLLAVLIPLIGGVAILTIRNIPQKIFHTLLFLIALLPVLFIIVMYNTITEGVVYQLSLGIVSPFDMSFQVDALGYILALVSSFVWFSATIFSFDYMEKYQDLSRFYGYLLLTLSGTIGVAMAGDFLTFLLFFELMTLASYVLVVHRQTQEAYEAGNIYLYMGVVGGLAVFAGAGLLYYLTGSVSFDEAALGLLEMPEATSRYIIAILFCFGFGIKAGMMPVHIWLPRAHPVAPSSASALLSGIMIKAGAFGIIRTFTLYAPPEGIDPMEMVGTSLDVLWQYFASMGYILIWIGVVTMLMGAAIALMQDNAKRLLAMSSISQMGYILMGIGAAAYLGHEGGMGLSGSIYHIINHAFFKSLLFLSVGLIYFKTKEINMYKLGGLWRVYPFTTVTCLIGILGITGFPGLNGYASKTLLHHAIEDSAYYGNHFTSLITAEKLFILAGAGTVAYFIKLFTFMFLGERKNNIPQTKPETFTAKIALGILSAAVVILGIIPHTIINKVLVPTLKFFNLDPDHLEYLAGTNVFIPGDLFNILISFVLGGAIFFIGNKTGFFQANLPPWLGSEFWGEKTAQAFNFIWEKANLLLERVLMVFKGIAQKIYYFGFKSLIKLDYKPGNAVAYKNISFVNLDFDLLIVIVMLTIVLSIAFSLQFIF